MILKYLFLFQQHLGARGQYRATPPLSRLRLISHNVQPFSFQRLKYSTGLDVSPPQS